ncbi:SDR family NAD(P)-dependent oxidoreductase [Calycomorphotria hydatis]|uniref:Glucose 1-dehydrogenase 1 n=1 Tax=Calycomorphotria hydatis TaxID=2528027 RepID=A0A517TA72_9PLAN|nr:glucose 1-dehydrogenase [Calycomorphotria hydatis]QDT65268.1 Glucose 1-dehydrogenase 1 [Calycomorphotria hydatis]
MSTFKGRIALVTGASKGIGAGIAKELAAAGAAVVVNYATDQIGAETVVQEILAADGRAVAIQGNVTNPDDVRRLLSESKRVFGSLDVLVNNAGVYLPMQLEEITVEEFRREFDTNVLGPLLMIRESVGYFSSNGGSVINIGSGASQMCPPGFSIYSASKSALDAITRVLSKELAPRNIRVNSINPGAVLSEGTHSAGLYGVGNDFERKLVESTPLGRIGTPSDIAKIVAFLASEDSGWLTGEVVLASGGLR